MDRNNIRIAPIDCIIDVALRKESVDRNILSLLIYRQKYGSRSPQGERG